MLSAGESHPAGHPGPAPQALPPDAAAGRLGRDLAEQAAEVLGIKSAFPAKKALAQANRLGSARIARAVGLLAEADLDLRGTTGLRGNWWSRCWWPGSAAWSVRAARAGRPRPGDGPSPARLRRRRRSRSTGRRPRTDWCRPVGSLIQRAATDLGCQWRAGPDGGTVAGPGLGIGVPAGGPDGGAAGAHAAPAGWDGRMLVRCRSGGHGHGPPASAGSSSMSGARVVGRRPSRRRLPAGHRAVAGPPWKAGRAPPDHVGVFEGGRRGPRKHVDPAAGGARAREAAARASAWMARRSAWTGLVAEALEGEAGCPPPAAMLDDLGAGPEDVDGEADAGQEQHQEEADDLALRGPLRPMWVGGACRRCPATMETATISRHEVQGEHSRSLRGSVHGPPSCRRRSAASMVRQRRVPPAVRPDIRSVPAPCRSPCVP